MTRMLSDPGFAVAQMGAKHAEGRFIDFAGGVVQSAWQWGSGVESLRLAEVGVHGVTHADVADALGAWHRAYRLGLNPVLVRLNNTNLPELKFKGAIRGYVRDGFPVVRAPLRPGLGMMAVYTPAMLPGVVNHLKAWGPWPYGKPVLHCKGIAGCPSEPLFKDEL